MRYKLTNRNPLSKNPKVKKYLETVTVTRYETAFAHKLRDIKYYSQYPFKTKTSFIIVDFYIPSCRLVFEIDGAYHDKQLKKDKNRDLFLSIKGIKVIRFNNSKVKDLDPSYLTKIILKEKKTKKQRKLLDT